MRQSPEPVGLYSARVWLEQGAALWAHVYTTLAL